MIDGQDEVESTIESRERLERDDLRSRALRILQEREEDISDLAAGELSDLVREMQLAQVELELQNDELRRTREQLADSASRYRSLFEFAPAPYFIVDREGWVRQANLAAAGMLCTSCEILSHWLFLHFVSPESRDDWQRLLQRVFSENTTGQAELHLHTWHGESRYAHLEATIEKSDPRFCLVTVVERVVPSGPDAKFAGGDLSHPIRQPDNTCAMPDATASCGRSRPEALCGASGDDRLPLVSRSDPAGRITHVNETLSQFVGQARDRLLGQGPDRFIHPDDLASTLARVGAICPADPVAVFDNRLKTSGGFRWVRWVCRGIFDVGGHLSEVLSVGSDVDAQKRAEILAADRQTALDVIYLVATQSDLSLVNTCAVVASQLALFLHADAVVVHQLRKGALHTLVRSRSDGSTETGEGIPCECGPCEEVVRSNEHCLRTGNLEAMYPAGKCFDGDLCRSYSGIPIRGREDKLIGVIAIAGRQVAPLEESDLMLADVLARYLGFEMEREAIRKQLYAGDQARMLGHIASGVAHEVRNPLNAILVTSGVLRHALNDGRDASKYIERIERQVQQVSRLMEDLLELRRPVEPEAFVRRRLSELVDAAVTSWLSAQVDENRSGVDVECVPPAGDRVVRVDPARMGQVLINLLANARQHTSADIPPRIVIDLLRGEWCRICVIDAGSGIDPDDLPCIFDPFFTTRGKGSGLGLSIARHIVERHGGELLARNNTPGPGACFEIRLPLTEETQ